MSVVELWRDNLTRFAESHRKTVAFGPEHPAVRAAKRYCDRTGATWEIGIGGRCELGKRALKQWGYELWQNVTARWALILLPILVLLVFGFVVNPAATGGALLVIAGILYALLGIVLGLFFEDKYDGWSLGIGSATERKLLIGLFIVTIPVSGPMYLLARLVRSEMVRTVLFGSFVIVMAGLILVMLYGIIMSVGWLQFLIGIGVSAAVVAALLGVIVLGGVVTDKVSRERTEKLTAAREVRRNDASIQHAVRDSLDDTLRSYYARNKEFALDQSAFPEFDAWRDRLEEMLADHGYVWEDLLSEWSYSRFTWLFYEDNYDIAGDFMTDLQDRWRQQEVEKARRNEQRRAKARNVLGFVGASLFLAKSRVCPNVVLPKRDQVIA